MAKLIVAGLHHVALYAPDPVTLAEFYERVLGLQIVTRSKLNQEGICSSIYLSCLCEDISYQLAIFANPDLQHTAFEVSTLTNLKAIYALIVELGLRIRWELNHGVSLAFYFHDPADNLIKLFWSTGIDYPQPYSHPIDLAQSESALYQDIAKLAGRLKESEGGNIEKRKDDKSSAK